MAIDCAAEDSSVKRRGWAEADFVAIYLGPSSMAELIDMLRLGSNELTETLPVPPFLEEGTAVDRIGIRSCVSTLCETKS